MKGLLALTYLVAALLLAPLVVATGENSDADRSNPMGAFKDFAITTEIKADDSLMYAAECDPHRTGN